MRIISTALIFAAGLLIFGPGCATPNVETQAKTGAPFSAYRTFALMPLPSSGPASDPGLMLRIADPARRALVESLTAKGLKEADRERADIVVNLRGESMPKTEVTDWGYHPVPVYGRYGRYRGSVAVREVETRDVEERTLSIEIFDNSTKDLVWVGWSKSEGSGKIKPEKLQERIRAILAQFPPQAD